jgi:hypothetical protein
MKKYDSTGFLALGSNGEFILCPRETMARSGLLNDAFLNGEVMFISIFSVGRVVEARRLEVF